MAKMNTKYHGMAFKVITRVRRNMCSSVGWNRPVYENDNKYWTILPAVISSMSNQRILIITTPNVIQTKPRNPHFTLSDFASRLKNTSERIIGIVKII